MESRSLTVGQSVQNGVEHRAASRLHNRRQLARCAAQRGGICQLLQLGLQEREEATSQAVAMWCCT